MDELYVGQKIHAMSIKRIVIIAIAIVAVYLGVKVYTITGEVAEWAAHSADQQGKGIDYMKSLSESEAKVVVQESLALMTSAVDADRPLKPPIPQEWQSRGVIRIDVSNDTVSYIWLGGMEHTFLDVRLEENGDCKVMAHYDDDKSEQELYVINQAQQVKD